MKNPKPTKIKISIRIFVFMPMWLKETELVHKLFNPILNKTDNHIYMIFAKYSDFYDTSVMLFIFKKKKSWFTRFVSHSNVLFLFYVFVVLKVKGFKLKKKMEENLYFSRTTMLVLFSIYQIRNPWNKKTSSNFQ